MGNQPKKSAENDTVQKIREYFDGKAEYDRVDKLSQAYLYINLTKDLEEINEKLKSNENIPDITLEELDYLFKAYCESPEFIPDINFPKLLGKNADTDKWQKIFFWWNQKPDGVVRQKLWEFAKAGTILSTLIGLIQYGYEVPKRQQQNYFQAWQLINTSSTQTGQGGRVEALEYINKDKTWWYTPKCKEGKHNKCLIGIKIEKANLNGVDLEGANLESSEFQGTSFRGAKLKGASFRGAKLKGASFKDAHLENADFTGADDFDPSDAILCNTTMPDKTKNNRDCKAK